MIWSIAWKNIWRSRIRSLIVVAAFTIGIFAGVFTVGLVVGVMENRVNETIYKEASHIQIHHPKYIENSEIRFTVDNYTNLIDSLLKLNEVKAVSPRIKIVAMAANGGKTSGIIINGINPENEKNVTDIYKTISEKGGTFFGLNEPNQVVIGEKLAKDLKLAYFTISDNTFEIIKNSISDEIVLKKLRTILNEVFRSEKEFENNLKRLLNKEEQAKYLYLIKKESIQYKIKKKLILTFHTYSADLYQGAFKVAGVFHTSNSMFDQMNVFVIDTFIRRQAAIPDDKVHEIALVLKKGVDEENTAKKIMASYSNLDIKTWKQLMPEVGYMAEWLDFYLYFIMGIILLALGFGIINTMLMAILERTKEMGMLMAIGMNKKRVFMMIMLETVMLSLVGAVIGMLISYPVLVYTHQYGIHFPQFAEGFEKMGYSSSVYPSYDLKIFFQTTILVIITGILASVYPARKALKLNPADAVRSE
jgi:ABC-type lipoprotein release transport system permease subunit